MNTDTTSRKYYQAFFAVALIALVAPLWLVEQPPLVDLPNHLARLFILSNYSGSAFFQQNFQIVYEPAPNLAIDLIVLPLMKLFDIWTATRLFLTLIVVLFAVGCHLIGARKSGEHTFSAVHAMFIVYGGTFFYGYVNYVFSVALFLVALGLWLRWREKSSNFARFFALAALTCAIYLSHLSAFAFFGAAIFFINLYDFFVVGERRNVISFVADAALFILPTAAFLIFMTGTGEVGTVSWNSLGGKAVALFGPFRSYDLWLDLMCAAIIAAIFFLLKIRGEIVFDRKILALAAFFFALFLVSPNVLFTSGDADVRIVLPMTALLFLSCRFEMLNRKTVALVAVALCLLVARQAAISGRWIQMSEMMAAEVKLLDAIAPESKVYPVYVRNPASEDEKFERPIVHAVHYITLKNSSFTPTVFAFRGQQPHVARRAGRFASLENEDKMKWLEYLGDNDYVWTHSAPQSVADELERRAAILVAERGKTKIWKLNK